MSAAHADRRKRWWGALGSAVCALAVFGVTFALCRRDCPPCPRLILPGTTNNWLVCVSPVGRGFVTNVSQVPYKGDAMAPFDLRLWDTIDADGQGTALGGSGRFACIADDGSRVAVADRPKGKLYRVDWAKGRGDPRAGAPGLTPVGELPAFYLGAFSPDGRWLALSTIRDREAITVVWDVTRGREHVALKGASQRAAFSDDGRIVVTADDRSGPGGRWRDRVTAWETASGRELGTVPAAPAFGWTIDPAGRVLACESAAGVELWTVDPFERRAVLPGVFEPVFLHGGAKLATAGREAEPSHGVIVVWDCERGAELKRIDLGTSGSIAELSAHPDQQSLLVHVRVSDRVDEIRRIDADRGEMETLLTDHFADFGVARRGGVIVLKSWKGPNTNAIPWNIHIWDLVPRQPTGRLLVISALAALVPLCGFALIRLMIVLPRFVRSPARWVWVLFGALNVLYGFLAIAFAQFLIGGPGEERIAYDLFHLEGPQVPFLLVQAHAIFGLNVLMICAGVLMLSGPAAGRTLGVLAAVLKLIWLFVLNPLLGLTVCRSEVGALTLALTAAVGAVYPTIFLAVFCRVPRPIPSEGS